jgi:CheY-like chemotaxis protein
MKTTARVLLADDEPTLRELIAQHLSETYEVEAVSCGEEAMSRLSKKSFDLVITEAYLPDINGSEVIHAARGRHPHTKTALITADSMEDCIRFAIDSDVGTIITKTIPFDLDELSLIIKGILTEDVFGLEKYLLPDAELIEYRVRGSRYISNIRDKILHQPAIDSWPEQRRYVLRLALDESISNAAYHGNRIPKGRTYSFSKDQEVEVTYGQDREKIGIAVVDQAGGLEKQTILAKLSACMRKDDEFLYQDSGRGLFLMLNIVHRLIINISKARRTEIIMLFCPNRKEIGHRPIIINEV